MALDLTTVFQTMPYVQNVAQAELVSPEVQQAVAQVLAQQFLARQKTQTQRIEKQDALATVQDDRRQRHAATRQQRKARRHAAEEETQTGNTSPFAGRIIDMKI